MEEGFTLFGSGDLKVSERSGVDGPEWMRPISREKIVYNIL